ncbi:uncharacterized protein J7T54_005132 [Emericellopsis cladophorae]|uniref:Uncharacterized protein n=1 Tax=Emericellopsis cladophorae TaxID=2686198 RepID=A0A9Q0BDI5_9HYPO|nr:uncharacterized protein J7T54_005132 [Emericellopsis cladophorae]KAI6781922.1 hypothetical protein J7T54_005132 [Emericellopsis cladophorae]
MSYYDSPQWAGPNSQQGSSNWEPQGATTPTRAGASAPQPQDDYAFSYQFDEVDRAYENLQKSGKGFMAGGRRKFSPMHHGPGSARSTPDFEGRMSSHGPSSRPHSNHFDGPPGPPGRDLNNFYASQRHQPSRGSNEAEQVMQAKRRMAAQRERELRNLHTEQQYQRNAITDASPAPSASVGNSNNNNNNNSSSSSGGNNTNTNNNNANQQPQQKQMSEEETRELIARQRSALYGEGPFADKSTYVDENGQIRTGAPGPSGPGSLRGASPFDNNGRIGDIGTPGSGADPKSAAADPSPRPSGTASPNAPGPTNRVFDNAVGPHSRTSTSSPTGASPSHDLAPGSKPAVAPIGTRPSGTPTNAQGNQNAQNNRSTTPMGSSGGWGRGGGSVWGQSGLGTQASVWG